MRKAHFLTIVACGMTMMLMTACGSFSSLGRHTGHQDDNPTQPRNGRTGKTYAPIGQNQTQEDGLDSLPQGNKAPLDKSQFLTTVTENAQQIRFLTSKVKFSVEVGNRQMALTGNLKMKRDDVIRLQLMAFGFVEAGRLEFTKEYVLIVDRINKQYLKVPYAQLDFLRNSNIDFYTLQALFWNELFQPGTAKLSTDQLMRYNTERGMDDDVVVSMQRNKLSYRWLTQDKSGRIKMANILFNDPFRGNYQLNWDYEEFKPLERKFFPTQHTVVFATPDKDVKFDMTLNYIGKEDDWETRTQLSGKYRQVSVDEILRRFMSL